MQRPPRNRPRGAQRHQRRRIQRPSGRRRGDERRGRGAGASRSLKLLDQVSAAFGDANASSAFPIARTEETAPPDRGSSPGR